MPFNPEDFLKLAEKICKDTDYSDVSEATFRTSISRAYYSVFLILRELTKSELYVLDAMLDKVLRSGLVHSCIKRVVGIVIGRFAKQVYNRSLLHLNLCFLLCPLHTFFSISMKSRFSFITWKYLLTMTKPHSLTFFSKC